MASKELPVCILDKSTQFALIEILDALGEETETIELNGSEYDVSELKEIIATCENEMPQTKKGKKKRGPKKPSAYNKFIGECRKSPDKGGRGLPFDACVKEWRELKERGEV